MQFFFEFLSTQPQFVKWRNLCLHTWLLICCWRVFQVLGGDQAIINYCFANLLSDILRSQCWHSCFGHPLIISGNGQHLQEQLVYCYQPFNPTSSNPGIINLSSRGSQIQNRGLFPFIMSEIEEKSPKIIFLHFALGELENYRDIASRGYKIIYQKHYWTKRSIERWWSFELTESTSIIFERILPSSAIDKNPQSILNRLLSIDTNELGRVDRQENPTDFPFRI